MTVHRDAVTADRGVSQSPTARLARPAELGAAKLAVDQATALCRPSAPISKSCSRRAKDLIGLLTLAVTFLGAFGKAYADTVL